MDNEAPNYATWIPEAGGYVANGKVVSRTPQYDANGKLVDVDVSQFPNTTPQNSKAANAIDLGLVVHPDGSRANAAGVPITSNTTGSGTDANAQVTGIGSLGSLAQNTQNAQDSAISSPATRSIVAGKTIISPEDEVNREYQEAVARGDLQGQINALTKASRLTGQDYSAEIENLTRQRQDKIQGIDDSYLQRINEAQQKVNNAKAMYELTGSDEDKQAYYQALDELNTLQGEQTKWRDAVGYQDAMKSKYQQEMDDVDLDYKFTFMEFIKDLGGQIMQALPGILNFQYDPYNDTGLQVAQQYAVSRVKEQMNATGMYYSSMTQGAMAKAVAELVPVYEKMAREEAIENFKLLQSTASFLMDLEATQFDMWKAQIQLKWDATNQKQREIEAAINNANARGYYTNEEAAKVGVAPGTESQAARERALDKQEQIEAEIRNLQQSQALAEFKDKLDRESYEEKLKIASKYATTTGSSGSGSSDDGDEDTGTASTVGPLQNEDGSYNEDLIRQYFITDIKGADPDKQVDMIEDLADDYLIPLIDTQAQNFGKSFGSTKKAIETIYSKIKQFAEWAKEANVGVNEEAYNNTLAYGEVPDGKGGTIVVDGPIVRAVQRAMDQISFASDDMDFVWGDYFTDNTKSKDNARAYFAQQLANSGNSALYKASGRFSNYIPNNVQETPAKGSKVVSDIKEAGTNIYNNVLAPENEKVKNSKIVKTTNNAIDKAKNYVDEKLDYLFGKPAKTISSWFK